MNLQPSTAAEDKGLTKLCQVAMVPEQGVVQVAVHALNAEYAVFRLDGEFFVTDDMCTHGMVSLSQGDVADGQIFCPLHGGAFDIRTGEATEHPCRQPLKTYNAVVIDGDLYAKLC